MQNGIKIKRVEASQVPWTSRLFETGPEPSDVFYDIPGGYALRAGAWVYVDVAGEPIRRRRLHGETVATAIRELLFQDQMAQPRDGRVTVTMRDGGELREVETHEVLIRQAITLIQAGDDLSAVHCWIVHPGQDCPDGCDARGERRRAAAYEEAKRRLQDPS